MRTIAVTYCRKALEEIRQMREQAMIRAIAVLRASNDPEAAKILEDDLMLDGSCKYCHRALESQFEFITLQDTCEDCWTIEGIHPATLRKNLLKVWEAHK